MNAIQTILDTTSQAQHKSVLQQMLEHAFLAEDGSVDFDQEVNGADLVDKLAELTDWLKSESEANLVNAYGPRHLFELP